MKGVSSSVSRVSPLNSSGVQQKCRQSCDISSSGPPDGRQAARRPHTNETANYKFSFNGIFESNPRSEGSVASGSTGSPVVSPMVAVNHSGQSSPAVDSYGLSDDRISENKKVHKRGRKRKHKDVSDELFEKIDVKRRLQKTSTTDELAQKFNVEVKDSDLTDNRIVTTIRTNKRHNRNVSEVNINSNETESKNDLMQRFLYSQSSNTSPAIQEDNDYSYNSYGDQPMTSAQSVSSGLIVPHPSASDQTPYPFANTSSYHQTRDHTVTDIVSQEIQMILSQLPPLRESDTVWSDCEPNDKSSDNELHSVHSEDSFEDRDHNHRRVTQESNSELDSELSNESNNSDNRLNRRVRSKGRPKLVTDYEVEKYCDQKWESVNGMYDAETEWRPWNQMMSLVSYNGDPLHVLPYVDIYSEPDRAPNDQNNTDLNDANLDQ